MHVYNVEVLNENVNPSHQGTQFDALGHYGYLDKVWDGRSPLPTDSVHYYGGLTQRDVKPTADSPLLKLGMDKVPPIVTTAILLDAKAYVGKGSPMRAGEVITAKHIQQMLEAQGLEEQDIQPGDVVYIYTGWSDHYQDPDTDKRYYSMAPGLSLDAATYLGDKRVVAVGLDQPFVDAVADGQLAGKAAPPAGTPAGMAFPIHHYFLTQAGVYILENIKLDELARNRVSTSCTMVLPLLERGASGSPVRPIAIGFPRG
jgi:kynurenine formamidase